MDNIINNSALETSLLLRTAAHENIRKYCDANNESFEDGLRYVTERAEKESHLIPLEFYRLMYNISLELINDIK